MLLLSFGCIASIVVADVQGGNVWIDMPPPAVQQFSFRNSRRLAQEDFQKTSPNFFDFQPNCEQLGARYCDYGPHNLGSGSEFASWMERSEFLYVNMARMDPTAFSKAPYNAVYSCTAKSGLDPFYWSSELTQASRFHSDEMAKLNFFSHDTARQNQDLFGSTSFSARMRRFLTSDGMSFGENIAAGSGSPLGVTNQWLKSAGHCSQIFGSADFMGVGYVHGASTRYRHYWTQNFLGGPTVPTQDIVAGTHDTTAGSNRFLVQVHMLQAPTTVTVVVGGTTKAMSLLLGTAKSGTYFVDVDALPAAGADGCVEYYFQVNSGASRMPADKSYRFLTYGVNKCKRNIGHGQPPLANVCTCANGNPKTGTACTTNNAVMCASCDSGYSLSSANQCKANSGGGGGSGSGGDGGDGGGDDIDNGEDADIDSGVRESTDIPAATDGSSPVDLMSLALTLTLTLTLTS
jgi:uncharacterized protein YkwD